MAQLESRNIFSFFKEVIVVLIGVLIALLINEWRESRNNENFVSTILEAVERDIRSSKEDLEKVTAKHLRTIDTMVVYLEDEQRSIMEIVQDLGGIQVASTKNISLNYMIGSRAELLNYELIALLANIESTTRLLDRKFDKFLDYSYQTVEATDTKSKRIFIIHLLNVIDSEQSLLELYDDFLQPNDSTATAQ